MGNKISLNGVMTIEELIGHLTGLTEGLKTGRVLIEKGTDFIVLFVSDKVAIKMEAKVKPDKAKLSLTLSWPLTITECVEHSLRISDGGKPGPHHGTQPGSKSGPCSEAQKS